MDMAGHRRNEPHDHVERRGFARAIRPQQSDNLPLLQSQGHIADHGSAAVHLDQALGLQHAANSGDRLVRRLDLRVLASEAHDFGERASIPPHVLPEFRFETDGGVWRKRTALGPWKLYESQTLQTREDAASQVIAHLVHAELTGFT